jgi:hypothetical protein
MFILHSTCKQPVTIAALDNDVAVYVYCDTCHDIVEENELEYIKNEIYTKLNPHRLEDIRLIFKD